VKFTLFEVSYISLVLMILGVIVYFYQIKMNEAADLILKQQNMLLDFNANLETQVKDKTIQLRELNELLEKKVEEKVKELMKKDELITVQSKQAVMGEMISMIAHQWRQPLSTITLEISNLQLKRLLGEEVNCDIIDEKLGQISDTIVYLSDTIDDFQTYFRPQKDSEYIDIYELLNKAFNFILPRIQKTDIEVFIQETENIEMKTYINELIQVIMILLNNAVDAHLEKKVKNPRIDISVKDNGERVLIFIEDNAGGISDEVLPHIFEPYFSTKAKNGTGLGLYMSQMIVQKQFHGEVRVESLSDGSIFIIDIVKHIA
jgi:C4-dicarboxylate-specific signal transduction histidine kinase